MDYRRREAVGYMCLVLRLASIRATLSRIAGSTAMSCAMRFSASETAEWLLPPKYLPVSASVRFVRCFAMYMHICLGSETDLRLDFESMAEVVSPKNSAVWLQIWSSPISVGCL